MKLLAGKSARGSFSFKNNLTHFLVLVFSITSVYSVCAEADEVKVIEKPAFACGSGSESTIDGTPGDFVDADSDSNKDLFKRVDLTLFESGPVRPLALSPDGTLLFVTNTPANCLEIYSTASDQLVLVSSVSVGLEPVAVAALTDNEVWVVNHLSDSVSIVDWDSSKSPQVRQTLQVGDEPRDIVFADNGVGGSSGFNDKNRVFITTAHRGQHHQSFLNSDLILPFSDENQDGEKDVGEAKLGRADIWVFDVQYPLNGNGDSEQNPLGEPISILNLFTQTPRALAVSKDGETVYAAGLLTGNRTALTLFADPKQKATLLGHTQTTPDADSLFAPDSEVIVTYTYDEGEEEWFWLDENGNDWSDRVGLRLPDQDVWEISVSNLAVSGYGTDVGTNLFNMVVNPVSEKLYVSNIDALNAKRFVGPGTENDTLKGHFVNHRVTVVDPEAIVEATGGFESIPRDLNDHINYAESDQTQYKSASIAQPTDMVITSDGSRLYIAGFGSGKVVGISTSTLEGTGTLNGGSNITHINTATGKATAEEGVAGGGPAGLALSEDDSRLYVYTRFDSAVSVYDVDTTTPALLDVAYMNTPEPEAVIDGRPFLYDATLTSDNGVGACGGCHIYGDFDLLAWDLGNPDGHVGKNHLPLSISNQDQLLNWGFPGLDKTTLEDDDPMAIGELEGDILEKGTLGDVVTYVFTELQPEDKGFFVLTHAEAFHEILYRELVFEGDTENLDVGEYFCLNGAIYGTHPGNVCPGDTFPYQVKIVESITWVEGDPVFGEEQAEDPSQYLYSASYENPDHRPPENEDENENNDVAGHVYVDAFRFFQFTVKVPKVYVGGVVAYNMNNFHPMKGPMTTQTLRGIADSGALHWRGDKTGCVDADCNGDNSEAQEEKAFKEFNEAFVNLLGKTETSTGSGVGLTTTQMQKYTDFIMQLTMPPNPVRQLNDQLTANQAIGSAVYINQAVLFADDDTCVVCHALPNFDPSTGDPTPSNLLDDHLFGTDKTLTFETTQQFIKVPQLRNMYQKVGMFGMPIASEHANDEQVSGFGYLHEGAIDTLQTFVHFVFRDITTGTGPDDRENVSLTKAAQVTDFLMAFDNNIPPIVGQQVTLRAEHFKDSEGEPVVWAGDDSVFDPVVKAQFDVMTEMALAGKCDLVKTDVLNNHADTHTYVGPAFDGEVQECDWVYDQFGGADETACFMSSDGAVTFSDGITKLAVTNGTLDEVTLSCLPRGDLLRHQQHSIVNYNGFTHQADVTVTASNSESGHAPDLSFDDDDETSWQSDDSESLPSWIRFDFDTQDEGVRFFSMMRSAAGNTNMPKDVEFYGKRSGEDDEVYLGAYQFEEVEEGEWTPRLELPGGGKLEYIRMKVSSGYVGSSTNPVSIAETQIEVFDYQ